MNKENKIKIGLIVCMAIVTFICFGIILKVSQMPRWEKTSFTVEYGASIDIGDKILNKESDQLTLDSSSLTNEKGKKYPAVGEYTIPATLNTFLGTQERNIKIIVKDTTAPAFSKAPSRIEVSAADITYDFASEFRAKDLSGVKLDVDTSKVDFSTAGTYKATVTATDGFKNVTKKRFKVVVVAEPVVQEPAAVAPSYTYDPPITYNNNDAATYYTDGTTYSGNTLQQYPNATDYNNQTRNQQTLSSYIGEDGQTYYYYS